MRGHADIIEVLKHVFRDAIVQHALAFDHLMFFRIEGSGIILEVLNQRSWLWSFIKNLRLAFVDAATSAHWSVPWLEEIHGVPWLRFLVEVPLRRMPGAALLNQPCAQLCAPAG